LSKKSPLKLLAVGSNYSWSIENYYINYLTELGVDIKLFPAQLMFYDYYYASSINKIMFRLNLSKILSKINCLFIKTVTSINPTHILVFKGMELSPKSLLWAKQRGIKLVNYNPDNPFVFSGKGSGNSNITKSIELYDLHFTYNLDTQKKLKEQHKVKTELLPFAFDISQELFEVCQKEKEVLKVCFLGNPDKLRASFIEALAEIGIEIDVYGNDWNNYINHDNITIFSPVYGDDQWKTLRKYRVQLNLMRPHNLDSHNMRTFEIPGIGGIQLAPETKEHRLFFEADKEIFLYNNVEECVDKINFLLSLTTEQTNQYRTHTREICLKNKHSYKDRALQVLKVLVKI
jgi:hypothetical protein